MAFLRIKKVKGKEYCYLVENSWSKRKGARQKVKKYLGPVVKLESNVAVDLGSIEGKDVAGVLRSLVMAELLRAGFNMNGKIMEHPSGVVANTKTLQLSRNGSQVVLALNEGYLCDFTKQRLLRYKKTGDIEYDSVELATLFVDAGIAVTPEALIEFYQKVPNVARGR